MTAYALFYILLKSFIMYVDQKNENVAVKISVNIHTASEYRKAYKAYVLALSIYLKL